MPSMEEYKPVPEDPIGLHKEVESKPKLTPVQISDKAMKTINWLRIFDDIEPLSFDLASSQIADFFAAKVNPRERLPFVNISEHASKLPFKVAKFTSKIGFVFDSSEDANFP